MWVESGIITKQPPSQKRSTASTTTTSTRATSNVQLPSTSSRTGWLNGFQNSTKSIPLFSSSSSSSSSDEFNEDTQFWLTSNQLSTSPSQSQLPLHPDDPNLYQIPKELHPTYRPLPILVKVCAWFMATLTSLCLSTQRTLQFLSLLTSSTWTRHSVLTAAQQNWKPLVKFLVKTILLAVFSQGILQDFLTPPTRISTQQLVDQYQALPSTLSNYESVPVALSQPQQQSQNLGVHYLQYPSRQTATTKSASPQTRFQALYVNHGFGASSLSWLPVLPKLVDRLQTKVGLGHDAAGFGFTDRPKSGIPNSIDYYTPTGSAAIGMALLQPQLLQQQQESATTNDDASDDDEDDTKQSSPVLLMGHSMGSLATLHMALSLPPTTKKWIVLVAPALGMRPSSSPTSKLLSSTKTPAVVQKVALGLGRGASLVGRYGLRRLVGRPGFWRKGLELAWGDPKKLSDGDVLRFQWPSIGAGWEDGLLRFVRAMASSAAHPLSDRELVERVLQSDKNAVITVIVGTKDKVVSSKSVQKFLAPYGDRIRIVEMEGLGHDPFEEDVDGFVNLVEQLLEEDKERILGSIPKTV